MKKYLKIFLVSSLLCSPLFGSSSLNAMKQSHLVSSQYRRSYEEENYNIDMKVYTSYAPEEEFALLDNSIDWKKCTDMLNKELKEYPNYSDNKKITPLFFLITCDDSPLATGIIQGNIYLRMIIKREPIDGINEKYIDEFIKENYYFILQNPPPTTKTLEISKDKNTEISIINEKIDQKPMLQKSKNAFSTVDNNLQSKKLLIRSKNNLQIKSEKDSRKEPIENKYDTNLVYSKPTFEFQNKKIISKNNSKKFPMVNDMLNSFDYRNTVKGSKNLYLIGNSNMINSRKNYNLNNLNLQKTIENYNSNEDKYPNPNYEINIEKLENSTLNNESSKHNNTYELYPQKYHRKTPTPEPPVKKYSEKLFYKYPQNIRKKTLNDKSHLITANKYKTVSIEEELLKDKEYNDLIQEQKKLMQQLVDSKESNRIKDNPGKYGLRYINPGLVKVPKDYKNEKTEKKEYEIPDNIGSNNITENNIGMRRKLYSQDENNPARIYNQKLNDFSLKKNINFIGLYNALTHYDTINLGQGDTYCRAMGNEPLKNFDFIKGEIINK